MGFQSGECYFDARPLLDAEAAAILDSVSGCEGWAPASYFQEGLFMAYADPGPSRLYVTSMAAITFDGRLDNRNDLKLQFAHLIEGEVSDSALALAAYELAGPAGFASLIGDWSLAIYDRARRQVVLASDFAGVRPLYYAASGGYIRWSTRLKPLASGVAGELDDEYVADLLTCGGSRSLTPYRRVHTVRPGHSVVASPKGLDIRAFWTPPTGGLVRYTREADYEERLRELFQEAVRCRIRADHPVLCELSGGFDSSSIVCTARHLARNAGVTASFSTLTYEREDSRDKPFQQVLESCSGFSNIHISTSTHAFLDASSPGDALPAFWEQLHGAIARTALEHGARTVLTGMLGDLVMGNWLDDSIQVLRLFRKRRCRAGLREALAWSYAVGIPIWWVLGKAAKAALPPLPGRHTWEIFADSLGAPGHREDSIAPAFRARMDLREKDQFSLRSWMAAPPERRKHFRGLCDMLQFRRLQPPERLEHLSWTHPYSHRPLVEFMLSIPPEIVCGPGAPRRLMRRAFQGMWPPELRQRRSKDSFGGVFLDSLRPLALRLLDSKEPLEVVERGYVDPVCLRARLKRLSHSLECNEPQLRQILLLEFWLRRQARRWT